MHRAFVAAALLLALWPEAVMAKAKRVRPPAPRYTVDRSPISGLVNGESASAYYDPETKVVHAPAGTDRYGLAHEVGHALDHEVLADGDRSYFQKLMGLQPGAWRAGTGAHGNNSPSEWFADYYAAAATGYDPRPRRLPGGGIRYSGAPSSYQTRIGTKRLKRFTDALERLQRRQGLPDYY